MIILNKIKDYLKMLGMREDASEIIKEIDFDTFRMEPHMTDIPRQNNAYDCGKGII